MRRSDLPHVGALAPDVQRAAVDAMWRAYCHAEGDPRADGPCPLTWVATFAEVLEASLAAVARPLRWRTDHHGDAGAPETRPAYPDDEHLERQSCGEPDEHPPHAWSREQWTTWRLCAGYALSDAAFLARCTRCPPRTRSQTRRSRSRPRERRSRASGRSRTTRTPSRCRPATCSATTGATGCAQMARKPAARDGHAPAKASARGRKPAGQHVGHAPAKKAQAARTVPAGQPAAPRNPRAIRELAEQAAEAGAGIVRARWRDVLGAELAGRVAAMHARRGGPGGPAEMCVAIIRAAVDEHEAAERRRAAAGRARASCQHPPKDRHGNRCGACGVRGIPAL